MVSICLNWADFWRKVKNRFTWRVRSGVRFGSASKATMMAWSEVPGEVGLAGLQLGASRRAAGTVGWGILLLWGLFIGTVVCAEGLFQVRPCCSVHRCSSFFAPAGVRCIQVLHGGFGHRCWIPFYDLPALIILNGKVVWCLPAEFRFSGAKSHNFCWEKYGQYNEFF